MHTGIGKTKENESMTHGIKNLIKVCSLKGWARGDEEEGGDAHTEMNQHPKIFAKSHVGIFFGVLLLVVSLCAIIMYHVYGAINVLVFLSADIILHLCLLIGCVLAFLRTIPLGYISTPFSGDDVLLLIAMLGSVFFEISVMIPSISTLGGEGYDTVKEPLYLSIAVLSCVQTVLQSLLIICSVRRYPLSPQQASSMPGRGSFAFLVVGNLAVWLLRSMVNAKGVSINSAENFYGAVAWLLIMNINYPLLLFYRFHSSVCFADVWHSAYTPLHSKLSATSGRTGAAKRNRDNLESAKKENNKRSLVVSEALSDIPEVNESVAQNGLEWHASAEESSVFDSSSCVSQITIPI